MLNVTVEVSPQLRHAPSFVAETFADQLLRVFSPIAWQIVATMQGQLIPGHGYDTGKLFHSFRIALVKEAMESGFDIKAEDVDYWAYVEFGHMTRGGNWWEGYHFAANAVKANLPALQAGTRVAWRMTAAIVNRSGFTLPDWS